MTDRALFERAYEALRVNPRWQTDFHDPVTGAWERFLDWLSQVDFSGLAVYLLLRIMLIVVVAWISHKLGKPWLLSASGWWKQFARPSPVKASAVTPSLQPEKPVDPATLVADAEQLARAGRFLDAISTLFKAGVAAANRWTTHPIGLAITGREIGNRNISPEARDAFRTMGRAIERGRFAGGAIDDATYQECRQACDGLIDGRSWRG